MHTDLIVGIDYLHLAYGVAAVVLAWDYFAPRLRLRQVRRAIALRARRDASRASESARIAGSSPDSEAPR